MNSQYKESPICNSQMQEQSNDRIYNRNIPSQMLQPYLDVRPVMTKYSYLPIVDPRKQTSVKLAQAPTFNVHKNFNPGNATAPWSGFASNVNTESVLRNQIYALQKCSQAVYVPNSGSDLYKYNFQTKTQPSPHDLLFSENRFDNFNPNPNDKFIGYNMFMNSTRSQVKDLTHHNN